MLRIFIGLLFLSAQALSGSADQDFEKIFSPCYWINTKRNGASHLQCHTAWTLIPRPNKSFLILACILSDPELLRKKEIVTVLAELRETATVTTAPAIIKATVQSLDTYEHIAVILAEQVGLDTGIVPTSLQVYLPNDNISQADGHAEGFFGSCYGRFRHSLPASLTFGKAGALDAFIAQVGPLTPHELAFEVSMKEFDEMHGVKVAKKPATQQRNKCVIV